MFVLLDSNGDPIEGEEYRDHAAALDNLGTLREERDEEITIGTR